MNIDWNFILSQCPKVYNMFYEFTDCFTVYCDDDNKIDWLINWESKKVCFCDIKRFFDKNKIYINIISDIHGCFKFIIKYNLVNNKYDDYYFIQNYKSEYLGLDRLEAERLSTSKAFEILEDILNK